MERFPRWREEVIAFDMCNRTGISGNGKTKFRKVRDSSRLFYVRILYRFAMNVKKPLKDLTLDDVSKCVGSIPNEFTQRHTCASLKKFLDFTGRADIAEKISVPSLNIDKRINEIDRVTPQEVKRLLAAEDNARNQALIALLYESAGRLSEVLDTKICDVKVDQYGVVVKLFGKTKLRNVRLVSAVPYVTRWLQMHAIRQDQKAPLFFTENHGAVKVLGKTMFAKIIRNAARKAGYKGVECKKFHPHAFRHGRLSELGHSFTDSELKYIGGWNDRRMITLYSHVDEDRLNRKLMSLQGIEMEEDKQPSDLQPLKCPRCEKLNGPTDQYCGLCGGPLSSEAYREMMKQAAVQAEQLAALQKLKDSAPVLERLLKRVETLEKRLRQA